MEKEMCLWYDSSANILKLSFSTIQFPNHASSQQTQHDGLFQVWLLQYVADKEVQHPADSSRSPSASTQ